MEPIKEKLTPEQAYRLIDKIGLSKCCNDRIGYDLLHGRGSTDILNIECSKCKKRLDLDGVPLDIVSVVNLYYIKEDIIFRKPLKAGSFIFVIGKGQLAKVATPIEKTIWSVGHRVHLEENLDKVRRATKKEFLKLLPHLNSGVKDFHIITPTSVTPKYGVEYEFIK